MISKLNLHSSRKDLTALCTSLLVSGDSPTYTKFSTVRGSTSVRGASSTYRAVLIYITCSLDSCMRQLSVRSVRPTAVAVQLCRSTGAKFRTSVQHPRPSRLTGFSSVAPRCAPSDQQARSSIRAMRSDPGRMVGHALTADVQRMREILRRQQYIEQKKSRQAQPQPQQETQQQPQQETQPQQQPAAKLGSKLLPSLRLNGLSRQLLQELASLAAPPALVISTVKAFAVALRSCSASPSFHKARFARQLMHSGAQTVPTCRCWLGLE